MLIQYEPYLDWIDEQHRRMYQVLIALADTNSGTFNISGLDQLLQKLSDLLKPLGGEQETLSLEPLKQLGTQGEIQQIPLGKVLRVRKRPEASLQVLLGCHMDTVFPADSPFQKTVHIEDNTLNGPGVADAKGGLVVLMVVLEALERSPWAGNIGWEILINPDEEVGSPGSAPLLEQSARRNHLGLVYEPSFPDGGLAAERKGTGYFTAVVRGRAAHAGRDPHLGRNAIRAVADFVRAVDDLNGQRNGVTINAGFVQGGGPVNIVPDLAMVKFNVRTALPDDEIWVQKQLDKAAKAVNVRDGLTLELHGQFVRKPKILSKANHRLIDMIGECGADLGMRLQWQNSGGCCDGNNLASAGLPNVDNLGVRGGNLHTDQEYMHLNSLTERAKLSALFLMKLASGHIKWTDKGQ
ncbi:MAG: hydrolase [Deltaproteobacteria bacterium]|nr:hydrolase [Deltaproteobacteria bacterium]